MNRSVLFSLTVVTVVVVGITVIGLVPSVFHDGDIDQGAKNEVVGPSKRAEIPVLGQLPDFALIDQNGENFGTKELTGKVWVANFIFTRCTSTCPLQTNELTRIQRKLKKGPDWDDIRLVSISVDPEHDTPEVLDLYAQRAKADSTNWRFLTGGRGAIWQLCKQGFKLPVNQDSRNVGMPIFHSPRFVLIDGQGRVRGYYDALKEQGHQDLLRDISLILDNPQVQRIGVPGEIFDPPWLKERQELQQLSTGKFHVFHNFQFTDQILASEITFENQIVDDAGKYHKPVHYDHGNGLLVADVDGDKLLDIYFITQIGPNELWKNLGDGRFKKISDASPIELANKVSVSGVFADFDNDGDADLYVTTVRGGNFLFENDGVGKFTDTTDDSGLGYIGHSSAALAFDYNRDGLLDIFLCNVGLYTTDERGLGGYLVGVLDGFSGHLKPEERNEPSILFQNLGNNRFVDVTEKVGLIDNSWTGDASPIDVNEDGWPDLYLLNMQGNDEYYENVEGTHFIKKSRELFPRTPWGSMGIKAFDFDNDGDMDIYITDMHSDMSEDVGPEREKLKSRMRWPDSMINTSGTSIFGNAFYRNDGDGKFTEISDQIGAENYWPWGLSVGDLNAYGFDDAFVASSMNYPFRYGINSVLLNDRTNKFLDSEFILGVEPRRGGRTAKPWFELDGTEADNKHPVAEKYNITEKRVVWGALGTRSSAIFDLDNDGDLDIVTNEFNDVPMVLISNLTEKKSVQYIQVRLKGTKSNRDGLGAKVTVHVGDEVYTKIFDGKSGYLSQGLLPLYFGLDEAMVVDDIEVTWPSGLKQTMPGPIKSGATILITEQEE